MSIKTATHDGVATIEIARPEKKNAITIAMYQAMADALNAAQADASVRAVLITGAEAVECGIANAVLPQAEVVNHARRVAQRFNALPPGAVRDTKKLLRRGEQTETLLQTIPVEGALFAERLRSPEAREAFTAFFQKRKPDFSKF